MRDQSYGVLGELRGQQLRQEEREIPGVVGACEFSAAVHCELRAAEVERGHTEKGGNGRSDRRTAWEVGSADEGLGLNTGPFGCEPEDAFRRSCGGVTLVGVVLEHWTAIDRDVVIWLVTVGVVRMGRVGVVRRDEERVRESAGVLTR